MVIQIFERNLKFNIVLLEKKNVSNYFTVPNYAIYAYQ